MICVVICLKKVMEVGGKKLDKDLPNSSDEVLPPHCQPCSNDGELLPAEGFCETCAEYLCDTCYKAHTIPTPSRNHVLLDKKQILRNSFNTKVKPKPSLCTIRCTEHPEEIVKFYCQTHDSVVCGVCALRNHQQPCSCEYIPDLKHVQTYKDTTEYQDILSRMKTIETHADIYIADVGEIQASNDEEIQISLHDIHEFRKAINEYIDRREKELLTTVKQMRDKDQTIRDKHVQDLQTLETDVWKSRTNMSSLQNKTSDLFVTSKQIRQQVIAFEKYLQEHAETYTTPDFTFKRNDDLQRILSSNVTFGTFERSYKARAVALSVATTIRSTLDFKSVKVTRLPKINMKTTGDKFDPAITGFAFLHPNTLLAVDNNNSSLKSVDTTNNTVTSQLSFTSAPFGVALLPGDQAAMAIPEEKRTKWFQQKTGVCVFGP